MSDVKQIPKLRFKEFSNDWGMKLLKECILKIDSGWSPICHSEPAMKGEWGSLKTTSVSWGGYHPMENKRLPKTLNPKESLEVLLNDILITRVGPKNRVGVVVHVNKNWEKLMVSDNMFRLKLKKDVFPSFLPIALRTFKVQKSWNQKIAGLASAQVVINQQILNKTKVYLPTLPEQKKTASFLTSVDEKITQLQQKEQLLQDYKKGVMQKVFSQQLRFKQDDGNNYPDWEEKTLGEVASKSSSNISANTIEENFGDYKIYGASGLLKSIDFYRQEERYISIVKDGAGVGRTMICDPFSSVLGTLDVIKSKESNNLYFIYATINNIHFRKYITGSTIPHIYFKDYSKEKIKVPCEGEQTKIANFLSAIDTKINTVNTQIENTQQFKKGLLQQMFV